VNPRFKVFDSDNFSTVAKVKLAVWEWLDELNDQAVVKPDGVTAGKGVGVWGDHFTTREQLFEHFLSNYVHGPVIVEEKIVGEESSFQAFCDGKHLVPLPETRDYKRAFDADTGPNTGGMGSFKDTTDWLPFTGRDVWEHEVHIAKKLFQELKGQGYNPNLRGVPFYLAFMHTGSGLKILECNSRPGDPEIQNLLPILKDDFVDVCFQMVDGTLGNVAFERQATVVTYKVPPTYGGKVDTYTGDRRVDLSKAYQISSDLGGKMKIYPGAMEIRNGNTYALTSRSICVVGVGDSIAEARDISLHGIDNIHGGSLWSRRDIASEEHLMKCMTHMKMLRG
jgi:phosphoribosylamine--glycine ligase